MAKGQPNLIKLQCTACKRVNYWSRKNKKKVERKIDLAKFCNWCRKKKKKKEKKEKKTKRKKKKINKRELFVSRTRGSQKTRGGAPFPSPPSIFFFLPLFFVFWR